MNLKTLIAKLEPISTNGSLDLDIRSICFDSRRVTPGALYVALRGEQTDGHRFIHEAIERGAAATLTEERVDQSRATNIVVKNSRSAMADLAAEFYHHPSQKMKMIGITGTNGKTTTTFLVKHILDKAHLRCAVIGTIRCEIGDRILPATNTTPEAPVLQELLSQARAASCKAVAMEVSSHALAQERTRGVTFNVGALTNLTQDHLDYHGSMENYFAAKSLLFSNMAAQPKKGAAVVNTDDIYGSRLAETFSKELSVATFGVNARADFRASNIKSDFNGTSFQLDARQRSFLVRLPLIGRFNVYNALTAIAAAVAVGVDLRTAATSLADAPFVPGRLEVVPSKRKFKVFVDYAHTDDALLNVIRTLRELSPARLIVVFGCGGDRDRAKRPKMGAVVDQHADFSIVTSDNPRKEDPEEIIKDILQGMRAANHEVVIDRKAAIQRAISLAEPRDIVLIAGKGHETYQIFADHTIPFDDVSVARTAIESKPVEMLD